MVHPAKSDVVCDEMVAATVHYDLDGISKADVALGMQHAMHIFASCVRDIDDRHMLANLLEVMARQLRESDPIELDIEMLRRVAVERLRTTRVQRLTSTVEP